MPSDLELRELVAVKVMGRTDCYRARSEIEYLENDESDRVFNPAPDGDVLAISPYTRAPAYESDIAAVSLVEARMKELGLERKYAYALAREVGAYNIAVMESGAWPELNSVDTDWEEVAMVIYATPAQRCRAALAAIEAQEPSHE